MGEVSRGVQVQTKNVQNVIDPRIEIGNPVASDGRENGIETVTGIEIGRGKGIETEIKIGRIGRAVIGTKRKFLLLARGRTRRRRNEIERNERRKRSEAAKMIGRVQGKNRN